MQIYIGVYRHDDIHFEFTSNDSMYRHGVVFSRVNRDWRRVVDDDDSLIVCDPIG